MPIRHPAITSLAMIFILATAAQSPADQEVKPQGECIAKFTTANIRSLANAEPKEVRAYLSKKIRTDAKKSGVTLSQQEAASIAESFDKYMTKGFTGNSSKVKVAAGTTYCRTFKIKNAFFVGVFLLKKQ